MSRYCWKDSLEWPQTKRNLVRAPVWKGLSTRHLNIQEKLAELYKILLFDVCSAYNLMKYSHSKSPYLLRNTSTSGTSYPVILTRHMTIKRSYTPLKIFTFLSGCIFYNICPINPKLGDFVKLKVFFLTIWILCWLSHNIRARTQSSSVWKLALLS